MSSVFNDKDVKEAISLIESTKLPHPTDPLLSSFIYEALNPRLAAQYIVQACSSDHTRKDDLLSIASDWSYLVESISHHGCSSQTPDKITKAAIVKRDGAKCCITGRTSSYWDPLIVVPILPIPSRWIEAEHRMFNMLGAFFTPSYRDWWLAYAREPKSVSPYQSHWLVSKSAAHAFAQGAIKLDRLQPSLVEYEVKRVPIGTPDSIKLEGSYPLLGDHSRSRIEKVDPRFIGTHARLSPSIRWLDIAKQISLQTKVATPPTTKHAKPSTDSQPPTRNVNCKPGRREPYFFTGLMATACVAVWTKFPVPVRLATYKLLRKLGNRLYGKHNEWEPVQRLPFGLYLKYLGDPNGFRNEFNALQMVRRYTSVPVPRPIDLIVIPSESKEPFYPQDAYLLTSRIPGMPLSDCMEMLSDEDGDKFAAQMRDQITQIRAIPKVVSPEYAICDTMGGPCRDPRISHADPVGPFVDETAFNQVLRNPDDESRRGHKIVFTHADLNLRNILVDRVVQSNGDKDWIVTGIVDWENSGYFPDYWDYTKSQFEGFRYDQRWRDFLSSMFVPFGDFSKEFEVEKRSWEEGDYI